MSTLNASRITSLTLTLPTYGAWFADCILEGGDLPSGLCVLSVGSLTLLGTVLRAGYDAPDLPHAAVIGLRGKRSVDGRFVGWQSPIVAPLSYQQAAGVRASTILRDLATASGETVELPVQDIPVGPAFSYPASMAGSPLSYRDVLSLLARINVVEPWRVDADGVTRFGARVGTPVTARATPLTASSGVGLTLYGIDDPSAFLPGNVLNQQPILRSVVREVPGNLTCEVWSPV